MSTTPTDRPASITTRAELLDALAMASELEHGLSLQYLYAAFSLRTGPADGLTRSQLVQVRTWAGNIFFVAAQEMFHLAQASNLLLAIGGAPHLARPNFPQRSGIYPTDLPWELTGFSPATIDRFVAYESATASGRGDGRLPHETIGEMYAAITTAFRDLPDHELFLGDRDNQIPGALVDFPLLVEVHDRSTAVEACRLIVDEGEGSATDSIDCHEGIFRRIRRELDSFDPTVNPARMVADNPVAFGRRDSDAHERATPITDPVTAGVDAVCNVSYDVLVTALFGYLASGRHDPAAPAVKSVTLQLMTTVIRPLGELLTRLPVGPGHDGLCAGPSFHMASSIELLPHREAARRLMAAQLTAAVRESRHLAGGAPDRSTATVLDAVADTLQRCASMLVAG